MEFKPHSYSAFKYLPPKPSQQSDSQDEGQPKSSPCFPQLSLDIITFAQFHKDFFENISQPNNKSNENKVPSDYHSNDESHSKSYSIPKRIINKIQGRKFPYNDTKNIPKNFGKAVIAFAQKNPQIINRCLAKYGIGYLTFISEIKKKKRTLHSIKQLRALWLQSQFEFAKCFREISLYFMKRGSLKYIFGSRVIDHSGHLKYRRRIMSALKKPVDFHSIKHQ